MEKIKVTMEDIMDFLEHPENKLSDAESCSGNPSLSEVRRYAEIMTDILNKKDSTNKTSSRVRKDKRSDELNDILL